MYDGVGSNSGIEVPIPELDREIDGCGPNSGISPPNLAKLWNFCSVKAAPKPEIRISDRDFRLYNIIIWTKIW